MAVPPIMTAASATSEQPNNPDRVLPIRGTFVRLSVPLDGARAHSADSDDDAPITYQTHKVSGRHTPIRRDSLDRREALLKGKEGSRQRRRWENDRLLSNPWAVAPLPTDWDIRPTYPTRSVPYYLAPLWDAAEFQRSVEAKLQNRQKHKHNTKAQARSATKSGRTLVSPAEDAASAVPKEMRAKLKRARAAKGLLQDLEEQVRLFLKKWNERQAMRESDGLGDVPVPRTPTRQDTDGESFYKVHKPKHSLDSAIVSDSEGETEEDEEIVFIGRNGTMLDSPGRKEKEKEAGLDGIGTDKMVFEGLEGDKGAGFARWLVHSIGQYYGLRTWSETKHGEPPMRSAYVGVDRVGWGRYCGRAIVAGMEGAEVELPRPLWGMV